MDEDDCSRTSAGAVAGLPDDLLVEILSRVPAKSVCRFKCVSKSWRDLIADHDHRKKLRQAMQGLFAMTPENFAITPETGHYSFSLMDLALAAGPVAVPPHVDDPGFSFLTERPGMHNLFFRDSCNGLVLFGHQFVPHLEPPDYVELGDVVCNPTTKQWACVPIISSSSPDRFHHAFLAFDPTVSSHFHLVQFQISLEEQRLLALNAYSSETGTWSRNQIDSHQEEQGLPAGWHSTVTLSYSDPRCAFLDGFLYLIVWDLDQKRILALDVQGKARRMITVPGVADEGHLWSCYLEQSQGCLHLMTKKMVLDDPEERYKLSIWVLQDYDTQEWVLKNTVSSLEVFGELAAGHFLDFSVVDIHQDRNVVFLIHYDAGKLVAYDMDHKEVSVIATFEELRTPFGFARYVPCFLESRALTSY